MIREAKTLLEGIIRNAAPNATVVRSVAEEAKQIMTRKFPLVALITTPGTFDGSEARTVRYMEAGQYLERYVRGYRSVPILIRCRADGEDKADALTSSILPEIPSQWEYDGFVCPVKIVGEEHSDHAGNLGKPYVSVIEVEIRAPAARKPESLPALESTEIEGGEFA